MSNFKELHQSADEAGRVAAEACPDGTTCGQAWIALGDARKRGFARWALKMGFAEKVYPKGVEIWVGEYGQDMIKKRLYAVAFVNVLRYHGVTARAGYRMT